MTVTLVFELAAAGRTLIEIRQFARGTTPAIFPGFLVSQRTLARRAQERRRTGRKVVFVHKEPSLSGVAQKTRANETAGNPAPNRRRASCRNTLEV
jgi:hypothetical protein